MLYDNRLKVLKDITDGKFALPEKFSWDESKAQLVIEYYKDDLHPADKTHPISRVHLAE